MKDIKTIRTILDEFRQKGISFITVTNSEWYSLFKDEIRNSIAIEGIFANRNELLSVLEAGKRTSNQKTSAILGYFEAANTLYEYANTLYKNSEFEIRLSDLKQIHTLLMRYEYQLGTFQGILGDFRNEDVAVTRSSFIPLNYHYLDDTLQVYIQWINSNIHQPRFDLLTFIAGSHILFETIHPFRDGNGRVGRILLSYLLIGTGLINIAIKGTKKIDRDHYYHTLEVGDDPIENMLRAVEGGKKLTVSTINNVVDKSNFGPLKAIILERLNYSVDRIEKGVKTIDRDILLPLRDAARFYDYSQDYLRQLIHQGKLSAVKRGKLWYVRVRDIEDYTKSHS